MTNADHFYPGFELAGLETQFDRTLTWTLCLAVLTAGTICDAFADFSRRFAPPANEVYDG